MEIAPQTTASYAAMAAAGACGVTLYQETYNESLYALYHPRGTKTSYDWRLEGPERAAEAGIRRLGLGLPPRAGRSARGPRGHGAARRLPRGTFPRRALAFSLPRIREAPEGFVTPYPVDDETFVRMYCALRLAFPVAESGALDPRAARAAQPAGEDLHHADERRGVARRRAATATATADHPAGEQFPVCDRRSVDEMAEWLRGQGFDVAWSTEK